MNNLTFPNVVNVPEYKRNWDIDFDRKLAEASTVFLTAYGGIPLVDAKKR